MAITKEITCIVGIYTNEDGQEKKRYHIGSIISTENGEMIKLDVIPLKEGGWTRWAYLNDPQPKEKFAGLPQDNPEDSPF